MTETPRVGPANAFEPGAANDPGTARYPGSDDATIRLPRPTEVLPPSMHYGETPRVIRSHPPGQHESREQRSGQQLDPPAGWTPGRIPRPAAPLPSGPMPRLRAGGARPPGKPMRDPNPITRKVTFRWRVTLLAAGVVGITVVVMAAAVFFVVRRAAYSDVDNRLESQISAMADNSNLDSLWTYTMPLIMGMLPTSETTRMMVIYPNGNDASIGDIELGRVEQRVIVGIDEESIRSYKNDRVLARHLDNGFTVIVAEDLGPTNRMMGELGAVLLVIGIGGILLAGMAGTIVARGGLRPVQRLTVAAKRVARTDDLTPIPVVGTDELAQLTESFNGMLAALAESRDRQSRLVADAGHELRTPLTSLRTNVELLIAASKPDAPTIPESDLAELRSDVLSQVEELSTLVGDLVDLAREDAPEAVHEEIDMVSVINRSVERVRRRRPDVDFAVNAEQFFVFGDLGGLTRAVLNVLDNAAKYSPAAVVGPDGIHTNATVTVTFRQTGVETAELAVADRGPGIPLEDRQKVFERFYRSMVSRAMPGSGLGLAIVKSVVVKHGGTVRVDENPPGPDGDTGTVIVIRLPGVAVRGQRSPELIARY